MEIKLLSVNEIQWAVQTANEVFEYGAGGYAPTEEERRQFRGYVNQENLSREAAGGRLFVWGAFENGQMCAVSAMQNVGHITMLYVRQVCQRRGLGARMLNEMRGFAAAVLHLYRVTVNVMPICYAPFFYKRGFARIPGMQPALAYVSLECPLTGEWARKQDRPKRPEITYPTKKIKVKTILIVAAVVLLISAGIGTAETVRHIVTGEAYTEESDGADLDGKQQEL